MIDNFSNDDLQTIISLRRDERLSLGEIGGRYGLTSQEVHGLIKEIVEKFLWAEFKQSLRNIGEMVTDLDLEESADEIEWNTIATEDLEEDAEDD